MTGQAHASCRSLWDSIDITVSSFFWVVVSVVVVVVVIMMLELVWLWVCGLAISALSTFYSHGIPREIGMRPDPPRRHPPASNLYHPGLLRQHASQ